jgi:hypothetical protein
VLTGPSTTGWTPAPTPPFDRVAGEVCDFPVHGDPVVDHVVTKVLASYPDGTIKRDAFKGPLIIRVTNTLTGKYFGFREGAGNRPRGLYVIDGLYRLVITADHHITLTLGHTDNVCDHID